MRHLDFIVLTGPTGTGKTELYQDCLKEVFSGRAINIDTGQFLEEFSVGTARPDDWKDHILFGWVNKIEDRVSTVQFAALAEQACVQIRSTGQTPIFVGGSMFYIKNLFWPIRPIEESFTKKELPDEVENGTKEAKYKFLKCVDPVRAKAIHPNDYYRVNRALEIWRDYGVAPSSLEPKFEPKDALLIYIDMPDAMHRTRIEKRTAQMLESGLVAEVQRLDPQRREILKSRLIGYWAIVNYLDGKLTKEALFTTIVSETLAYAKEQRKFFRRICQLLSHADVDGRVKIIKLEHDGSGSLPELFKASMDEVLNKQAKHGTVL